jgi:N6-L-threonylcarbamoyladenine synthase
VTGKPFYAVNHLYGHVASNYLESDMAPPFICLIVSGGHTQLVHVKDYNTMHIVGETLDDAVGEVYDKLAREMGLGFPGGTKLDRSAQAGNSQAYPLPIARTQQLYDFSFSGLKTAVLRVWEAELKRYGTHEQVPDNVRHNIAASFQYTAVNTLMTKTLALAQAYDIKTLCLAGGVSANSALRAAFMAQEKEGYRVQVPSLRYSTDNAAMIGASAYFNPIAVGEPALALDVFSRSSIIV